MISFLHENNKRVHKNKEMKETIFMCFRFKINISELTHP